MRFISFVSAFYLPEALRKSQTELVKIFVFLYALKSVNAKSIKVADYEFSITASLISCVFVLFGLYSLLWFLQFLREFLKFASAELSEQHRLARELPTDGSPAADCDPVQQRASRHQLLGIDNQRFKYAISQDIIGFLVTLSDFWIVTFIVACSFFFAM